MNVTASFNTVGSTGYYNPLPGEENLGGHALCVIGYDDQAKRFEIINSWGTGWGNNGFFTISVLFNFECLEITNNSVLSLI